MKKVLLLTFVIGVCFSFQGYSQFDIKGKLKSQANNRINDRIDQGIDKGLNKIEEGVGSVFKKQESEKSSEEEVESPQNDQGSDSKGDGQESEKDSVTKPQVKIESSTKYDFVAGDKILFFEDFSQDAIGDFPALWTTEGSGEVRTVKGFSGNWLLPTSDENVYCLMKDLVLPKNFIFEFDVIDTPENEDWEHCGFYMTFFNSQEEFLDDRLFPGKEGFHITFSDETTEAQGFREEETFTASNSQIAPLRLNELNHVIVWVQDRRIRIYHDGQKVIDGPSSLPSNATYNRFRISLWGHHGRPFFSNLKITTAAPDTRSKLLTEGKLISYGIFFDSGKDIVKPESWGALNDIAKVLKENPAIKVKIVGHTDSDGNDALNLDLSKRRAASVKNELVKNFGIDGSLLETDGKGETQPISPNATPEGKAQNRRVEFIKL